MRNLRKFTAVVIAIALVLTSMTAAFAATTPVNADKAATLKSLALYEGQDANDPAIGLENALTTQDSLIFLAKLFGYFEAAGDLTADEVADGLAKFDDAASISDYAKNVVAYSAINGILSGSTKDDKFFVGAKDTVTAARFATFMLKQMGYVVPSFTEAVTQISEVKGSKVSPTETGDLTRDAAVGMMYAALTAEKAAGTTVIAGIATTDALKAIAEKAGLIAPSVLAVSSVTATNLAKIAVKFNKEVNSTIANTVSNYTISGGTAVLGTATLQADNCTVVLQLATAATNQDVVTVTVKNIKDAALVKTIADTSKDVTMLDTTVPSALSATLVAPNKIKVTFSEPITAASAITSTNYKIDSYTYSLNGAPVLSTDLESVTVTLGTDLPKGEHTITVNPESGATLADAAGFKIPKTILTFQAGTDTVAPTVSVKSNTESTVTLVFNEDMKGIVGNANFIVRHTYNSNIYQVTGANISAGTGTNEYIVNFGNAKAFPVGTVNLYLSLDSSTSTVVEDSFGNDLVLPTTLSFTNVIDTTAPTATIAFVDATHLDVTYSETVTAATTVSNYTLKNSSGTVVNISGVSAVAGSTNVYRITTAQMNGGTYTLAIANVKDTSISANAITATTLTFNCSDAVAPTVTAAGKYSTDLKKIVISYAEAMATTGTNSVLDLSNYVLYDGATIVAWPAGTTVSLGTGNTVVITFTAAQATLSAGDTVVVGRVADVVGNKTAAISSLVTLAPDSITIANIRAAGVKAINRTTITFEVDSPLSGIDITKFTTCNGSAVTSVSYENKLVGANTDINGAVVTVKVTDANKWLTDNVLATVDTQNGALTTSLGTTSTAFTTAAAGDYMASEISSVTTQDTNNNGKIDHVVVVYSENLNATSIDDNDFTVNGYTVTDVALALDTVTLTITEVGYDTGAKPTVTQVGTVADDTLNKNVLAASATCSAGTTDGADPIIVDTIITVAGATAGFGNNSGDTMQIIFSEDVALKTGYAIADLENDFILATGTGTATADGTNFTGATISVSGNTVTVVEDAVANVNLITVGNTIDIDAANYVAADILAITTQNPNVAGAAVTIR